MERIWGGHRLASLFGKRTPPTATIGESWEIVDRPEAQSVVRNGSLRDRTLHELWTRDREAIFGNVPGAKLHVGLRHSVSREEFEQSVRAGSVASLVHSIDVQTGDSIFLPSGRFHAIGGGNVVVEIQQNSDTTYRVFDWNRVDDSGKPRQLHIEEALESIDFEDVAPGLIQPDGEILLRDKLFEIEKWALAAPRVIAPAGQFAIVCCLTGLVRCVDVDLRPAEFALIPAVLKDRTVQPREDGTTLLRITMPR